MAKSINFTALTAGSVVKGGNGYLQIVNITGAGDAAASVTIYDNPSAATGNILFAGKGASTGSYIQTAGVSTPGVPATIGMFIVIAGTTSPTVQIIYE
jgi:hypothetical protein